MARLVRGGNRWGCMECDSTRSIIVCLVKLGASFIKSDAGKGEGWKGGVVARSGQLASKRNFHRGWMGENRGEKRNEFKWFQWFYKSMSLITDWSFIKESGWCFCDIWYLFEIGGNGVSFFFFSFASLLLITFDFYFLPFIFYFVSLSYCFFFLLYEANCSNMMEKI